MKAYIAGPMRGIERYNFPAFDHAADWLIAQGWDVINPASLDRAIGVSGYTDPLPEGFMHGAMKRDFAAILTCDALVFLPGWEQSVGAKAERFVAEQIGLRFFHVDLETGEVVEESSVSV